MPKGYQAVTDDADSRPAGRRLSPWRLLPVVVIVAGLVAFFALGLDEYLSFAALSEHRQALLSWYQDNTLQLVGGFFALYGLVVARSWSAGGWWPVGGGAVPPLAGPRWAPSRRPPIAHGGTGAWAV